MALSDDLPIDERLKYKKAAYDKFLNLQPALDEQQRAQSTQIGTQGIRDLYKNIREGGYSGRQAAGQTVDKTQLELAKATGQQRAEQDALAVQGAGMKEDIIGSRQKESLSAFNRRTQEMEDAMDKAVAERAFDLGMTSKELAFHVNSKVADLGLSQMKADYDAGNVSKLELQKVADNLQKAAAANKQEADNLLAQLKREGQMAATAEARKRQLELTIKMLERQKEAAKQAAKASNIANIITGAVTIGGAALGTWAMPGVGTAVGASIGSAVGNYLGNTQGAQELGSSVYGV